MIQPIAISPAAAPSPTPLRDAIELVLAGEEAVRARGLGGHHPLGSALARVSEILRRTPAIKARPHLRVVPSAGRGSQLHAPRIALLDDRETTSLQRGVFAELLFRADGSGVYLALDQGVGQLRQDLGAKGARAALQQRAVALRQRLAALEAQGFTLDGVIDGEIPAGRGADHRSSIIAHRLYARGHVPEDAVLLGALAGLLEISDAYVTRPLPLDPVATPTPLTAPPAAGFALPAAVDEIIAEVARQGFSFEPWQIAAYVTAIRTKPFVILAGVSGTGKSRLPSLVAEAMGGVSALVPVRPDWTDSAEILGYVDLAGHFRPGALLSFARAAAERPALPHVFIVDEMNLARVEQYLAEVLSRVEDRAARADSGFATGPLLSQHLGDGDAYAAVGIPPNLAIVGTVNMDETTHGFSRKVLDRAFTLELSEVDLRRWKIAPGSAPLPRRAPDPWPAHALSPRALRLGALDVTAEERAIAVQVIDALSDLNRRLGQAQLQVGYRVRDEIVLFVLHAREILGAFTTSSGEPVDPLDLALQMKILPRIAGGSGAIRAVVRDLLGYAQRGPLPFQDDDADALADDWRARGRPTALPGARHPRTAARLALMWDRLLVEGATSYWL